MIALSDFTVTEKSMRPASIDRTCFYCGQPIGDKHLSDCVLVVKRVKIRFTVEYEVEVPSGWDRDMVNFRYNESTWCPSNVIEELKNRDDFGYEGHMWKSANFECTDEAVSGPFLKE